MMKTKMEVELTEVKCLVFSTSLQNKNEVMKVADSFDNTDHILEWSVDLDDWEKVLRVVCKELTAEHIIQLLFEREVTAREMET
jgi:hypothetical protein